MATTPVRGFIEHVGDDLEEGLKDLNTQYQDALTAIKDPAKASDPGALAKYQECLGEYQAFQNVRTSMIKVFRDMDLGIISNYH